MHAYKQASIRTDYVRSIYYNSKPDSYVLVVFKRINENGSIEALIIQNNTILVESDWGNENDFNRYLEAL